MQHIEEHIKRISEKMLQLAKAYSTLQKENERLKQELFAMVSREKEKDAYVDLITLRIEVLKASRNDMGEEERKVFEKKITKYLKDIDQCIGLLNE